MDEFDFIDTIKQKSYNQPTLLKGIGDDGAVFQQTAKDIVTVVDTFVEGVHFTRKTIPPSLIGYRCLAANISDIAAMGAKLAFYLVSIVIPNSWTHEEMVEIFGGMKKLASKYHIDLIGGDTVSGSELTISITVIGYVQNGKSRYRSLAKPKDIVFVTGTLGDAQAGLYILMNPGNYKNKEYFIKRHQQPSPRVEFAQGLTRIDRLVFNDISDGIVSEAREISQASKVDIMLHENKLPVSKYFKQFPIHLQSEWKLYGGEDFELLGTVAREDWPKVQQVAERLKLQVTEIGEVLKPSQRGQVYLKENNQIKLVNKSGYIHFRK